MLGGVIVALIVACHGGASPAAQSLAAVGKAKHAIADTTWSATARVVRLAPVIITAPAE
jgi:hypothetical protein